MILIDLKTNLYSHPRSLKSLNFIPILVLGVHGHELEQHQVEQGGDDGETEHYEEQGEDNVLRLGLQRIVLL